MPEVVGRLRPPRIGSAPATPALGELYYDTGANTLYWWNGTQWVAGGAVAPSSSSGCQAYRTVNMTLPFGITTVIPFDGETYDTDNYHSTTVNPSRLTVPKTGIYQVTVQLDVQTAVATALDTVHIYINGNDRYTTRLHPEAAAKGWNFTVPLSLNAGDYIEAAYQSGQASGAHTLTLGQYGTTFSAVFVGGPKGDPGPTGPGQTLLWDSVDAGVGLVASMTTPTLDQTFAHLMILYEAAANVAGAPTLCMRLNGDAAGHYYGQRILANNGAVTSTATGAGSAMQTGLLGGTTNTSYKGSGVIWIPNYAVATAHPVSCVSSAFSGSGSSTFWTMVSSWMKGDASAAVSTITFIEGGGNTFLANSRISVYGIPG